MRALHWFIALLLLVLIVPLAHADDFDARQWRRYSPASAQPVPADWYSVVNPDTRQLIVARAHQLVGQRYRWGGESEETGFDCSGLLVYLYRSVADQRLPRTTRSMIARRDATIARHELQPGDAVFFSHNGSDRVSHVGLYIGDNRFIHAPSTGKKIRIDSLASPYWKRAYVTARNFSG
ncbi:C40 family peptidase [Pseudomonas citronellolis]|uniref:C40 family peptidase n=1 Tax=Pseudomonas citronellolis TaxID=53408 RepID=UPI0009F3799E|nr:C40 family peptidase [Pseudomonas humi]